MMALSSCWVSVVLFSLINPGFALRSGQYSFIQRTLTDQPSDPDQDKWFPQILDHFDRTNSTTWNQRYQVDDSYFDSSSNDGPVFLMINGESSMGPFDGAVLNYAEKFKGLCFQLEHRFYGASLPTGDLSLSSLRYLSSEQALADIARFIDGMNKEHNLNNKNRWVLFGGSYAGNLVAWSRLKYPHLVHAAISSSGPVLAQMNYRGYDRVVRESLEDYGEGCANDTHQAFLELEAALKKPNAAEVISKKFNICGKLNLREKWDVPTMFWLLSCNFHSPNSAPTEACQEMTNGSDDLMARLANLNNPRTCFDVSFFEYLQQFTDISHAHYSYSKNRAWEYQKCNEFGYFKTSVSTDDLFGSSIPLQFFIETCQGVFGKDFDELRVKAGVTRTNHIYGGKDIVNHVTNVVFVQGSLDPWHVLGVYNSSNPDAPAILIEGTRHCANMSPSYPSDPPQLVKAREQIVHYLEKFLLN